MTNIELYILNYLANALWQVPLVCLVAALAARIARSAGPQVEHRIWAGALFLEAALPAYAFGPGLRSLFFAFFRGHMAQVSTQTTILDVAAVQNHSQLAAITACIALLVYAGTLFFVAGRLLYRLQRARSLCHAAQIVTPGGDLLALWQGCADTFAVHDAQLATSTDVTGPSTIGIRHRIVFLPPKLLTDFPHEDLTAALAHEFAHMRRRDFAKNLLYELIALPVAWHPLLWLTRLRIAESREMVCDEMASHAMHSATRYAHSLLRLAASFSRPGPATTLYAIGIVDANGLERRIMKLSSSHSISTASRRAAVVAVIALGIATCASAMSLRLEVPASIAAGAQQSDAPVKVASGVMAGKTISKVPPVYPPEARAKGINGTVVLHAIIGKNGAVQKLDVISGPKEFQKSALDAVKHWVYRPYLLNGERTEVDTTITINYFLAK